MNGMENISSVFQRQKRKKKRMERLSFITNSRLSFYHRLPIAEKCLEKWLEEQFYFRPPRHLHYIFLRNWEVMREKNWTLIFSWLYYKDQERMGQPNNACFPSLVTRWLRTGKIRHTLCRIQKLKMARDKM